MTDLGFKVQLEGDFEEAEARVREALAAEGPRTVPELPRRWPVTGGTLHLLVVQLEEMGLVRFLEDGPVAGKAQVEITPLGRAYLEIRPGEEMNTIRRFHGPTWGVESLAAD